MADEQKNRTETGSKADLDRQIGRTWPDIFRYYSTAIFVTHLRISGLLGFALFFALLAVKLEGTSYRGLSFWIASVSAFVALLYAFRLTSQWRGRSEEEAKSCPIFAAVYSGDINLISSCPASNPRHPSSERAYTLSVPLARLYRRLISVRHEVLRKLAQAAHE